MTRTAATELVWTTTRRPFVTPWLAGTTERHTSTIDGADIVITHLAATVEKNPRGWDVGIRASGRSFDRIFAGQPHHATPSDAQAWVNSQIGAIRRAIAAS